MIWHDSALYAASVIIKNPFRNLWPLLVAPALALRICNRTAHLVPRIPAGSAPAAALAAVPGLVGLVVICQAIDLGTVITWRGVVFHWVTPVVAGALAAYAIVRAVQRQALVMRLFEVARPARGRLASTAARLGMPALEIPSDAKDCFVAGVLRPTVFVSRGALAALDDTELDAALHHERTHVRGRDTLSLMVLAFLRDLAPWGKDLALDAFRAAREAAADRAAAHSVGPLSLAAALLALARPGHQAAGDTMLHMASGQSLRWRMQALLNGQLTPKPSTRTWIRLALGCGLSAVLLAWPLLQWQVVERLCIHP